MGLQQGCSLLPILFLIYIDTIVKKSESCGAVKIGDSTVQRLLFLDDLALLDSIQNGLLQALDGLSDTCSVARKSILPKKKPYACPDNHSSAVSPSWWSTTKTIREIQVPRRLIHK